MCTLYSITTNQDAIKALFRVTRDSAGNLPSMPSVFSGLGRSGGASKAPARRAAR